jgi:hypothetical protein
MITIATFVVDFVVDRVLIYLPRSKPAGDGHSNNRLQKNQNYRLSLSFLVTVSTGSFTLDQSYSIIQNKLLLTTDCLEDSSFYSLRLLDG